MNRQARWLVLMATAVSAAVCGCIANPPTERDMQATVDAAVLEKETQLETKAAADRDILLTQIAGEFIIQLDQLRSDLSSAGGPSSAGDDAISGILEPTAPYWIATPTLSLSADLPVSQPIPTVGSGGISGATAVSGECVDRFEFLSDVTFPDGTMTLPNTRFDKTWYIRNSGTCDMTRQYKIIYISGSEVAAAKEFPLFTEDKLLRPGESTPISVPLTAPETKGKYSTTWGLKNPGGKIYGSGSAGNVYLTSVFQVGSQYNFYENLSGAICRDDIGLFFCGSSDRSSGRGAAYYNASPTMESNYAGGPSILIAPPAAENGTTRVSFGPVRVTRGTWLRSAVSCPPNSPHCDAFVRLLIAPNGGTEQFVAETHETNDGLTSEWNTNLSDFGYHDQDLTIIFEVQANGGVTSDDLIIFMNPRLTDIPPR